jgi:signal transduction histidine kinase
VFFAAAVLISGSIAAAQAPALSLTPEETRWIREHHNVQLGVDPAWPPFSFIGKDGRHQGIDAEILQLVAARTGLQFELVPTQSWSETEARVLARHVELVPGVAETAERAQHVLFTRPYLSPPAAVIMREEAPFWVGLRSLLGHRVAAAKNYVTTEYLQHEYPELTFVLTDNLREALDLVAHRRADAVLGNLVTASHLIKTNGFTNLKIVGLLDRRFELRLAVQKDQPELHAILDKTLATITERERFAILDRWISVNLEDAINWALLRRVGTWVLLVGGGLVAAGLIWNRKLARELAERRKVEARLEVANTSLQKLNDDRRMLMNTVAHDLNGPLGVIAMSCDFLRPHLSSESIGAHRDLDGIRLSAERMISLVDNLLSAETIERGERKLSTEPILCGRIFADAVDRHRRLAEVKKISLEYAARAGEAARLRGDPTALSQVAENLIGNALKFTPPEGRIAVVLEAAGPAVQLVVTDSGPGVRPEERSQLFQKFVRLSAQPTGGENSNGLGLAIVKLLVTAMDGEIRYDDAPGGGAQFTVTFPRVEES